MKTIILAGGFGTRLSEYTDSIPKPMVAIGGKPILWHIMNLYAQYGKTSFCVALGYKGDVIKKYFSENFKKWNIELIDTGQKTMTGGRVKRLQKYVGKETCMLTYGDGVSNVNIKSLLDFHNKSFSSDFHFVLLQTYEELRHMSSPYFVANFSMTAKA